MSVAIESQLSRFNRRFLLRFQVYFGLVLLIAIATIIAPESSGQNDFLNEANVLENLRLASIGGIIAIGMTLVVLTGGIDLSVGAVLTLCSVGAAIFMIEEGYGLWQTIAMVLLLGMFIGFCNGFITAIFSLQSYVTTLAMLGVAQSMASIWSDGDPIPISYGAGEGQAPTAFRDLFARDVALPGQDIPVQAFFFLAVWLLAAILLNKTRFGRHVFAVGGNETAARLSGIGVDRVRIAVFAISGLLVGLAALLQTGLDSPRRPIGADGYEFLALNAIAAVAIGGTRFSGGIGTVTGTVAGVLILQILDNLLDLKGVQPEYQVMLKGAIIVIAVMLHRLRL